MRAYLAGSKVDKNGIMLTLGVLESMALQVKSMPITLGFDMGKGKSVGVITRGFVKDGKLYVEGTVDKEWMDKFLSPCVSIEEAQFDNDITVWKKCKLHSVFVCDEHADVEATPIERTEEV